MHRTWASKDGHVRFNLDGPICIDLLFTKPLQPQELCHAVGAVILQAMHSNKPELRLSSPFVGFEIIGSILSKGDNPTRMQCVLLSTHYSGH